MKNSDSVGEEGELPLETVGERVKIGEVRGDSDPLALVLFEAGAGAWLWG